MLPVKYNMYNSTEQLLIISLCTFKAETDWRVRPFLSVHINFNYLYLFFTAATLWALTVTVFVN